MSSFQLNVALLSLVDTENRPQHGLIAAHLAWLQSHGVQGVLVMGTTGEFPNFSVAERQRYLEAVLQANPGLRVMVNIGATNLSDIRGLQAHALAQAGVNSLLLMPPFYYPGDQINGLEGLLEAVLAEQPKTVPFYLYHYPKMSQVSITPELLTRFPQVAGLKDTSGDFGRVEKLIQAFPDREVFVGTDFQMRQSVSLGAAGVISGMGNLFPDLQYRAIQGDAAAETLLESLRDAFVRLTKMPAMKAYLNRLGLHTEKTQSVLPFVDLPEGEAEALWADCQAILTQEPHYVG